VTGRDAGSWFERAFGVAYPVVYAHRDQSEARRALAQISALLDGAPAPWLDLGCGQGRHLAALAASGRRVLGLDLSAALLAKARLASPGQPLVRADMRWLPLRDDAFGAVLSLFTAFGYFGSVEQHEPVVHEVARVLQPGGAWVLDFLDSERVAAELADGVPPGERISGPLRIREARRLEPSPRRVVKEIVLTPAPGAEAEAAALGVAASGQAYTEEVTLFTLAELDALAAAAGLRRRAAAGSYDGAVLRPGRSERWLLVYGKPAPRKEAP
jgi:SAM-dependent methyltransferase